MWTISSYKINEPSNDFRSFIVKIIRRIPCECDHTNFCYLFLEIKFYLYGRFIDF